MLILIVSTFFLGVAAGIIFIVPMMHFLYKAKAINKIYTEIEKNRYFTIGGTTFKLVVKED